MKSSYSILFVSILCVLVEFDCSKNNPPNRNLTAPVSSISGNAVGSYGTSSTTNNQITSGTANVPKGVTEAEIKGTLQTLNSLKWNKSMFDFSNSENVKALDKRNKIVSILMKNPSVLQREDVKTTLIDLFNNQTKYAMEYVHEHPEKGLGENYAEGGPNLGGLMIKYMDKRSLYTEIVLLGNTHDFLTTYWKESAQLVLQRITDVSNNKKAEEDSGDNILRQIAVLGKAQNEKKFTLDPEIIKSFKKFAFNELKSSKSYNREPAAEALQYVATKDDKEIIKALKTVAKSDPYRYYARPVYPVREAAQRALEYIEKQ